MPPMTQDDGGESGDNLFVTGTLSRKTKKLKKKRSKESKDEDLKKKKLKSSRRAVASQPEGLSPAQQAVQELMRRALEEDQYSAAGSIVDTESDEEDCFNFRGQAVRLDKSFVQQTVRKLNALDRLGSASFNLVQGEIDLTEEDDHETADGGTNRGLGKAKKKKKRKDEVSQLLLDDVRSLPGNGHLSGNRDGFLFEYDDELDRDGGSIFGATTGASNSTWVECDKCKKWRRLRGIVDEKKLPSKWYCSMNKNDPDRARCSAPEEEYETPHTAESAADARIRKHLRVWVRRLQCNEAYEARLPTLTRGKKRASTNITSKDPYEWVRCCNPSCGKWRSILRIMDAKSSVIDRANHGEWFCVMNTWDEKTASCAAPQENLPAIGCPPWILQDERF